MVFGLRPPTQRTRSLLDVWVEQRERERERDDLVEQTRLLRQVGRRGDSSLLAAQRDAFSNALDYERARLERPSLRPRDYLDAARPSPLQPPATISREAGAEPPFGGGRGIVDVLGGVSSFIGTLPVPGGPITIAPSARGGRPGATISNIAQPPERTLANLEEFESRITEPVTRPVSRFAGEAVTEALIPPGVPGRERAIETVGGVAEEVGAALLRPSNLIPIPIIDPVIARLLSLAPRLARGGARVTPEVVQNILRRVRGINVGDDAALGTAKRKTETELSRLVGEHPVAGAADNVPTTPLSKERLTQLGLEPPSQRSNISKVSESFNRLRMTPERAAGRQAQRDYEGGLKLFGLDLENFQNEVYDQARQGGFRIRLQGARQSDEVIEVMERLWLRGARETFTPEQRPFVDRLYASLDEDVALMLTVDPSFERRLLPNYFPHLFKGTVRPAGTGRAKPVTNPFFKKRRKLRGPLAEILEENPGLDLRSWDPVDFVVQHRLATMKYVLGKQYVDGLKVQGYLKPRHRAPSHWVEPDIPAAKSRVFLKPEDIEAGAEAAIGRTSPLVAPPDVAAAIKNQWGESAFREGPLLFVNRLRQTAFGLKVIGGLFQQVDFTLRTGGRATGRLLFGHPLEALDQLAAIPRAWGRSLIPAVDRAIIRADTKDPIRRALLKADISAGADPSIADRALSEIGQEFLPGIRKPLRFLTSEMYSKFHKEMLLQAGEVQTKALMRRGFSLEEAAARAAETVNEQFSSIAKWQSVFRSPTTRDAMRLGVFAVGEFEGWFRITGRALTSREGAEFLIGLMVMTAAMAESLNLLFTGRPLSRDQLFPWQERFDKKGLSALKSGQIPFISYNTKFLRPELPWKGPDGRTLYLDLLGQADTPFRWLFDPRFAAQTRLGQLPSTAISAVRIGAGGEPLFGRKPEGIAETALFAAEQVSPIAFGGFFREQERIGIAGAGTQVGGLNVSAEGFGAMQERIIQDDAELGLIRASDYPDGLPNSVSGLTKSDEEDFWKRHIDLAEVRDRVQGQRLRGGSVWAQMRQEGDDDRARLSADLDSVTERFRSGSFLEGRTVSEANRAAWDAVDNARTMFAGTARSRTDRFAEQIEKIQGGPIDLTQPLDAMVRDLSSREYRNEEDRILAIFHAVNNRWPTRDNDIQWDGYERELAQALSPEELRIARAAGDVGDHHLERARSLLLGQIPDAYWDIPEGTSQRSQRLTFRAQNVAVDAALWLLGKVSRVQTSEAQEHIRAWSQEIWGTELEAEQTSPQRRRRLGPPVPSFGPSRPSFGP